MPVPVNSVVIADDHDVMCAALKLLLNEHADIKVVGSCNNGDELRRLVECLQPDLVVTDIAMPGTNVFETVRKARSSGIATRFMFFSAFLTDGYLQEAFELGAAGYMLKMEELEAIRDGIVTAARGGRAFSPEVTQRLARDHSGSLMAKARVSVLSPREREVLCYVAMDMSGRDIAIRLGISARTIDRHKSNIMDKLGIRTQVGLTRFAIAEGLVHPDLPHRRPAGTHLDD